MSNWNRLLSALGVVLLVIAGGSITYTLLIKGNHLSAALLEAAIDSILIGVPGIAMVYAGTWLPSTTILPELYSRIVAWTGGGIVVMGLIVGLRELHPGVELTLTGGTQVILLSISSVTGLLVGVLNARTHTQAKALERKNRELKRKYELEKQNEQLKRTERRLENAITELEASNERLEEFAYAVSHDLQEPLRMVTSYLQLLERRYGDELEEDGEEFVDYAVDGAERMRAMIDGLLEYSRVETRGDPFESVDLEAVLDDVYTDLQFKIEETDAELERAPMPTVYGDEAQLRQVLQNLLTNAMVYSGEVPPRIRISAERDGPLWTVSVSDDGIGMDPDNTERIFDIFRRLHTNDEQSGSGIGLAICKRVVERHGGDIWVETEPGVGSTFCFQLYDSDRADLAPAGDSTLSRPESNGGE
ncbi:sensor histidine kinase [Natronorubrum daqingense]|uniref:histidine kinase n=1 Tax=Natronorubrum daqingense TaxID=588898 RepID=A0A1N7EVJ6_9EURY|nr:ATP-binding protein [Natronorubrum daqingense]APX97690.1 histidine kinase [Natronorubrum daqingense]SIR92069.1 His Kinase A (phospho-acceptor) domain-containing protein [Natronorubrum daqingense]